MEIYIEIFLIQNVLINICLLRLVYLTTKSKTNLFLLTLSSILGATSSLIAAIYITNNLLLNFIKLITAFIMIITAFKQNIKQFVFNFILLFLYTYAFGGIIISLSSATYQTSFGLVTTSKFSLEIICLIILLLTYIFELITRHLKFKIKTNNLLFNLTLTQADNTIKINAYLDTGNFLNINGQPVLVLDLNTYLKLTKTTLINFYLNNFSEMSAATVNGNKKLKVTTIDKLEIKNKNQKIILKNQIVAINTTNCFKNTNYQALISPLFL